MKFKIIQNEQTPKIETYKDIETFLKEDRKLLEKFISFSMHQHNCAGLASNQVSVDGERIMEPFFTIKDRNGWDIIIHPKILKYKGKKKKLFERCLTWRGMDIEAERYPELFVIYFNLKGEVISKKIIDYEAQIWQHECNHLRGVEEKFVEFI